MLAIIDVRMTIFYADLKQFTINYSHQNINKAQFVLNVSRPTIYRRQCIHKTYGKFWFENIRITKENEK